MSIEDIKNYEMLEDVVRTSFASVVWSHKIQEKQAEICTSSYKTKEAINIIAASLTSAGLCAIIFTDPFWLKVASAVLSLISTFISAHFKSFDVKKAIDLHKTTANKLLYARDKYKILLMKIKMHKYPLGDLVNEYQQLHNEASEIYNNAPNTSKKAVEQARFALKVDKDSSFTDNEIDLFLPGTLKREQHEHTSPTPR